MTKRLWCRVFVKAVEILGLALITIWIGAANI